MSDKMREEFEAWEASRGYPVDKSAKYPGEYRLDSVQDSWIGYSRAWRNQQAVIDAKNELLAEQEMTISNYMDINEAAAKENGALKDEIAELRALLGRAYGKLIRYGVENTDPLLMDEIKLELTK